MASGRRARGRAAWMFLSAAATGVAAATAAASVDVALVPDRSAVLAGDVVRLRLTLTADSEAIESFASVRIILNWDPAQLRLIGQDRTGAVSLMTSGFPGDPSNLNEATIPQDGDAVYVAFAALGNAVEVDQEGTLLTTFLFETLAAAPVASVTIPVNDGLPAMATAIFSGTVPNLHITGTLSGAQVPVFEEPTRLVLTGPGAVAPGEQVVATVSMENLNGQHAAGFVAAVQFDPAELTFIEGAYSASPFGASAGPIVAADGVVHLAASISEPEQVATTADALLATLTFEAVEGGCISSLTFAEIAPGPRLMTATGAPLGPMVLINPEAPDPVACDCPCDLDGAAGIDVFDLLAYLDFWFAAAPEAERTGQSPPSIDVFDLLAYLDCWFAPPPACG